MKTIGVILCSKTKTDKTCSVREMYNDSVSFRARRIFMDLAYDEWYVNTSKYGFMNPNMVIEPYESWYITATKKTSQLGDNNNVLTEDMIEGWLEKVKQQFPNRHEVLLHCHLSLDYFKRLQKVFPNAVYIRPQRNFTSTAWRYYDAAKMLLDGAPLHECLEFVQTEYTTGRPKEQQKWFYHIDGRKMYGKAFDLAKDYDIDHGCAYAISMGSVWQGYGWATDEALLPHIQVMNGRYKLTKKMPKIDKSWKRVGIAEKLDELENEINNRRG